MAPTKRGGRRLLKNGSAPVVSVGSPPAGIDRSGDINSPLGNSGQRDTPAPMRPLSEQVSQSKPLGSDWATASSYAPQRSSLSIQAQGYAESSTTLASGRGGDRHESTTLDDAVASAEILNPSDALNILVQAASSAQDRHSADSDRNGDAAPPIRDPPRVAITEQSRSEHSSYEMIAGKVGRGEITQLVEKCVSPFQSIRTSH